MLEEEDGKPWKGRIELGYERLRREAEVIRFILWPRVDGEIEKTLKQKE